MRQRYPLHTYKRSARLLKDLRSIKSALEIEVMQKAMDITDVAFRRLLGFIRPGVMEYEIEAEIFHSFLSQRATGPAYGSIIASGDRARTLHYVSNSNECKDGELVLMDFGAEYGNYCADLTRTVPVSGRFTKRQKAVYNACLHLHDYAKSLLKPGITIAQYTDKVGEEATAAFVKLGLINKSDVNQSRVSIGHVGAVGDFVVGATTVQAEVILLAVFLLLSCEGTTRLASLCHIYLHWFARRQSGHGSGKT